MPDPPSSKRRRLSRDVVDISWYDRMLGRLRGVLSSNPRKQPTSASLSHTTSMLADLSAGCSQPVASEVIKNRNSVSLLESLEPSRAISSSQFAPSGHRFNPQLTPGRHQARPPPLSEKNEELRRAEDADNEQVVPAYIKTRDAEQRYALVEGAEMLSDEDLEAVTPRDSQSDRMKLGDDDLEALPGESESVDEMQEEEIESQVESDMDDASSASGASVHQNKGSGPEYVDVISTDEDIPEISGAADKNDDVGGNSDFSMESSFERAESVPAVSDDDAFEVQDSASYRHLEQKGKSGSIARNHQAGDYDNDDESCKSGEYGSNYTSASTKGLDNSRLEVPSMPEFEDEYCDLAGNGTGKAHSDKTGYDVASGDDISIDDIDAEYDADDIDAFEIDRNIDYDAEDIDVEDVDVEDIDADDIDTLDVELIDTAEDSSGENDTGLDPENLAAQAVLQLYGSGVPDSPIELPIDASVRADFEPSNSYQDDVKGKSEVCRSNDLPALSDPPKQKEVFPEHVHFQDNMNQDINLNPIERYVGFEFGASLSPQNQEIFSAQNVDEHCDSESSPPANSPGRSDNAEMPQNVPELVPKNDSNLNNSPKLQSEDPDPYYGFWNLFNVGFAVEISDNGVEGPISAKEKVPPERDHADAKAELHTQALKAQRLVDRAPLFGGQSWRFKAELKNNSHSPYNSDEKSEAQSIEILSTRATELLNMSTLFGGRPPVPVRCESLAPNCEPPVYSTRANNEETADKELEQHSPVDLSEKFSQYEDPLSRSTIMEETLSKRAGPNHGVPKKRARFSAELVESTRIRERSVRPEPEDLSVSSPSDVTSDITEVSHSRQARSMRRHALREEHQHHLQVEKDQKQRQGVHGGDDIPKSALRPNSRRKNATGSGVDLQDTPYENASGGREITVDPKSGQRSSIEHDLSPGHSAKDTVSSDTPSDEMSISSRSKLNRQQVAARNDSPEPPRRRRAARAVFGDGHKTPAGGQRGPKKSRKPRK